MFMVIRSTDKYPWEDWTDGHVYEVCTYDYDLSGKTFQHMIHQYARDHGMKAHTAIKEGLMGTRVRFQFYFGWAEHPPTSYQVRRWDGSH